MDEAPAVYRSALLDGHAITANGGANLAVIGLWSAV